MKMTHQTITSSIFELVKTVEVDIQLSGEISRTNRIEIFQNAKQSDLFRCRVWEIELFRLTPSFPRNENDEPFHITDDTIMVERGIAGSEFISRLNKIFKASSIDDALEMIFEDLKKFLEKTAGRNAK